jgi:hypothetical protein
MKHLILALFMIASAAAQTITTQTVDTGTLGRVGRNTSHAVIAGNPAIIYADFVKNHLLFSRNTAADGSGSWIKTKITSYDSYTNGLGVADSHVLKTVAGNPAVAFSGHSGLKFARCTTADGSGPWTVYNTGLVTSCANLEVVDGNPALTAIGDNGELLFARCTTSDGSGAWTTVVVDVDEISNAVSLSMVAGKPAIAYRTQTTYVDLGEGGYYLGDLRYAVCTTVDGLGTWTSYVVESEVNAGGQLSLAEVDGKPAIGFSDQTDYDLRYARCENADGSGEWILTSVDAAGTTGAYPSLMVVDGKPAIAYQYGTGGDLRYARNASADGSGAWTVTNAHTTGITGSWASLAVVDGKPAISFHYSTGYDLMWARNALADGSGAWAVVTADNAANSGRVGEFSQMAIVSGKPMSIYQDTWWDRPKVAAAGTVDGIGAWTSQTPSFAIGSLSESIAEVAGRPAVVYKDGSVGYPKFSINANADGSGAWTTTTLATSTTTGVKLGLVAGYPVAVNRNYTQEIFFLRNNATDATGSWATSPTGLFGNSISTPLEVAGTPAFCMINTNYAITFTRNSAADATGSWETHIVDPIPPLGNHHYDPELQIINGKPAVFFVQTDNTGTSVRLATNSQADGSGAWSVSTLLTNMPDWKITSGFAGGNPAFTWLDDADDNYIGNLMLTRNTAADGTGTWLTYTLDRDRAGDAGSFVTVGAKTGITFYDYLNRNLEYLLVDTALASLSVEHPATFLLDTANANIAFDATTITRAAPVKSVTIRNMGTSDLTITGIAVSGANASEFVPDSTAGFTLLPGATRDVAITFTPTAVGIRTATLQISSDDPAKPTFSVNFTGEGLPYNGMETWRLQWFGSIENIGAAALNADPDNDGTTNLYEFAYGLNPTLSDVPPAPQFALKNGNIEFTYVRGTMAVDDLWFNVPWSETLNSLEWVSGDAVEEILSDNGTQQTVKAVIPMGSAGKRFVRLEIHAYY